MPSLVQGHSFHVRAAKITLACHEQFGSNDSTRALPRARAPGHALRELSVAMDVPSGHHTGNGNPLLRMLLPAGQDQGDEGSSSQRRELHFLVQFVTRNPFHVAVEQPGRDQLGDVSDKGPAVWAQHQLMNTDCYFILNLKLKQDPKHLIAEAKRVTRSPTQQGYQLALRSRSQRQWTKSE